MHNITADPFVKMIHGRIIDHLIQYLNKFPDADGKGTPLYTPLKNTYSHTVDWRSSDR